MSLTSDFSYGKALQRLPSLLFCLLYCATVLVLSELLGWVGKDISCANTALGNVPAFRMDAGAAQLGWQQSVMQPSALWDNWDFGKSHLRALGVKFPAICWFECSGLDQKKEISICPTLHTDTNETALKKIQELLWLLLHFLALFIIAADFWDTAKDIEPWPFKAARTNFFPAEFGSTD